MITTIEEMYAAINPLPAMLSAKGRAETRVQIEFEANTSRVHIWLMWKKEHNPSYSGDMVRKLCAADTAEEAVAKALEEIAALPSMMQENQHAFMRDLGRLIDNGRKIGIEVEYLNPLVESMKKLSENIITHQPSADDDMPF